MSNYKSNLQTNNEALNVNNLNLQSLINQANALPDAGSVELPELQNEGSAEDLMLNKELIDANGNKVTGTFSIDTELNAQDDLITQIQTALQNKASASEPVLQTKTVTPTSSFQFIAPDSGYDGLSQVTVNGDANLKAENIKSGVSIFGITGTASGGSGNMENCFVTLYGESPISGNEQIWYIDGSSSPKSINFPSFNNRTTITVLKNSILCSYNVSTGLSGNISRCISNGLLKVYFVSGNASISSM